MLTKQLQNASLASIAESSVLFSSAFAIGFFLPSERPFYSHPITIASLVGVSNFFLRRTFFFNDRDVVVDSQLLFIRSLLFANYDAIYRTPLFHEAAHALVAKFFYPHAQPHITLNPPWGGKTQFFTPRLNTNKLSKETISGLISAAGPLMDLIWFYGAFLLAQKLQNNHPEISSYLRMSAWFIAIGNILYALSALNSHENESNDYVNMKDKLGVSPIMAAVIMLGQLILSIWWHISDNESLPSLHKSRYGLFSNNQDEDEVQRNGLTSECIV